MNKMGEILLPESMEDAISMGCCGLQIGRLVSGKKIRFVSDEDYERYQRDQERRKEQIQEAVGPDTLSSLRVVGNYKLRNGYDGGEN